MSASCVPGRTQQIELHGVEISAAIIKGVSLASSSNVAGTEPSTESSRMGTKAAAASAPGVWLPAPRSPNRTPAWAAAALRRVSRSNNAACEKVPSGPEVVSNRCHVHEPIALRSPGAWGLASRRSTGPQLFCIVPDMQDPLHRPRFRARRHPPRAAHR